MPRAHRQLLEGGLYHVYNRFARGEEIFAESDEADRFVSMVRKAKKRDGVIVYAWCLREGPGHNASARAGRSGRHRALGAAPR